MGSLDRLPAQLGFIEQLNEDAIRIGTVKRRTAVAVNLKWMHNRYAFRDKLLLKRPHPLEILDDKSQVIELSFFGSLREYF